MSPIDQNLPMRQRAYAELGITRDQVSALPQITPQLRLIERTLRRFGQLRITRKVTGQVVVGDHLENEVESTRYSTAPGPGSDLLKSWPYYLASSDHKDAKAILLTYYGIHHRLRPLIPIEAFCAAANVSPMTILEIIVATCVRFGAQASTIIAAVNQPRVVEKSVEMALTDDGFDDRTLLAKATGFLPTPKGPHTTVNVAANATSQANAQSVSLAAPPPEHTIRRLVDRFNEARTIPIVAQPELPAAEASQYLNLDALPKRESILIDSDDPEPL